MLDRAGQPLVPVVVTDARLRVAVNIIRSLGRAGIAVTAVEAAGTPAVLGFRSRFTAKRVWLRPSGDPKDPPPAPDAGDLIAAAGGAEAVFIPVSTAAVRLLAGMEEVRAAFGRDICPEKDPQVHTLVPPLTSLHLVHDKVSCLHLARSRGLPTPASRVPAEEGVPATDEGRLLAWAKRLSYPVIVKYRSGEDYGIAAADRIRVCASAGEVVRAYPAMHAVQPDPLVQEYVVGRDVGVALLYDLASRLVAAFTYRSLRQRPKSGGPTAIAESVWIPALVDYAVTLLDGLGWRGLVMLDFREARPGSFQLLEVNPRYWGSLALSIAAGVDFPLLYYQAALGGRLPPVTGRRQRDGVRMRFFPHDFLSVLEYASERRGFRRLGYLVRSTAELLNPWLPDGLFTWSDLGPGLAHLAGGLVGRRGRA